MGATLLQANAVARPWGRLALPPEFARFERDEPVGEIHHAPPQGQDAPLLVKHLFSAERLSVQVHPGDAQAAALGLRRGKDEAWLILAAEPDATLGLGLVREVSTDELAAAARSGEIEDMLACRLVQAGDFFFSPAGTIHAIGAGLSLIEIQQNSDVTYRLYDYGRPRELHVEQALAVADRGPWRAGSSPQRLSGERQVLLSGGSFVIEEWTVTGDLAIAPPVPILVVPREGTGRMGEAALLPGQVWSVEGEAMLGSDEGMTVLAAYAGGDVIADLAG